MKLEYVAQAGKIAESTEYHPRCAAFPKRRSTHRVREGHALPTETRMAELIEATRLDVGLLGTVPPSDQGLALEFDDR